MSTLLEEPGRSTLDKIAGAMTRYERWGLAVGVGLQFVVLLGMIGMRAAILWTGETYYVRVQPVDPRDWLRGDYVILGYEFSRLPQDQRRDWSLRDRRDLRGATVFVSLSPEADGKHWRAERFSLDKPQQGPFLRGQVDEFGRITYGIESYFVQEGKGHEYEDAVRSGRLTAEIVVKGDGQAALRKLHVEAK